MSEKKVLTVTGDVKWIGVLDYDIVTFDVVMETKYGTTYNSYFIDADKKAIVEATKEKFWDVYLEKIKAVVDPAEIEYIIVNHTEPDHSGNLRKLLEIAPKAVVVGSRNAIRYLNDIIGPGFPHLIVKDGDTLDLGNKTIRFIGAPNLHWPDTMYSYLEEDNVLFTCDSFGCHFADSKMFDDEVGYFDYAFRYYFDVIIKPFSKFMIKAIEKIEQLDIDVIATGHGPILRSDWRKYVNLTKEWSEEFLSKPEKNRVFIPYVSAYHKTGVIAEKIAEGLKSAGDIEVDQVDVETTPLGELDEKLTLARGVIVGSPVINQNILLPIYKIFALINPYRDKGKLAGAFGSYGWSGENKKLIESNLVNLKLKFFGEGVFVKFTPDAQQLEECVQYGKAFGEELLSSGE
jgi:flavorubredoxin